MTTESVVVDVELATEIGLYEAIMVAYFANWIRSNRKHSKNQHEGRTWTYGTYEELAESLPFMSYKQVRSSVESLLERGIICKGMFGRDKRDRTTWYAFVDESKYAASVPRRADAGQMQVPHRADGTAPHGNSNNNVSNKELNNRLEQQGEGTPPEAELFPVAPMRATTVTKAFKPPSEQEVAQHMTQRLTVKGLVLAQAQIFGAVWAQSFHSHYSITEWKYGRQKIPLRAWKIRASQWVNDNFSEGKHLKINGRQQPKPKFSLDAVEQSMQSIGL